MKLQLIAPMRGISNYNYPALDAARDLLVAAGHDVWSPADHDRARGWTTELDCPYTVEVTAEFDYEEAMKACLESLATRDAGVVLAGWEESSGAQREVTACHLLNIPVLQLRGEILLPLFGTEPTEVVPPRAAILDETKRLVCGDRNVAYGEPSADFTRIAALWSVLFERTFTAHEVAMAMICVKLSRLTRSPERQDHWVDICGYGATGGETIQPNTRS